MKPNVLSCLLLFAGLTGFFSSCRSPQISRHYATNHYLTRYDNVVYNDSIPLFVSMFGDVTFERDPKKLSKRLGGIGLPPGDSVVMWGSTEAPPHYTFMLTMAASCPEEMAAIPNTVFYRDTCMDGRGFRLVGFSKTTEVTAVANDLTAIWSRMEFGTLDANQFASIFSITGTKTNKLYEVLDNIRRFPVWSDQDQWNKTQLVLTYASFLGDNEDYRQSLALLEHNMAGDSVVRAAVDRTKPAQGKAVLNAIVQEARSRQLVMINENHFYPNHRVLVFDLLDSLKTVGYGYLALEALAPEHVEAVNTTRHVDLQTGFYTQEQQYVRLLHKALALGFTLVAYENIDQAKDREEGQAERLFNNTFAKDSTAKVLVLAGMDHILESPTPSGKKWMATVFKERYGIDPLTINQNDFKHLRHLAPDGYLMFQSDVFANDRLRAVDFHVINNQPIILANPTDTRPYRNRHRDSVQVLLFHTDKPIHVAMANEVPYATMLVPGKSMVRLPYLPGRPIQIVAYDRQGRRVD